MANSVDSVLAIATSEVGYSRWSDPENGTKYGRWYAKQTGSSYYGTNGVPYCAMFVSWVMDQAGAKCEGIPGAYCPWVLTAGRKAGKAVPTASARKGDVVLFDWEGDGVSDHIGFVERNSGGVLYTIEGNTNNGAVARRARAYGTACGVIRPDYDGSTPPAPPAPSGGQIDVDGKWGSGTTRALQRYLGTYEDGVVSDQASRWRGKNPGLTTGWEWHDRTTVGSNMIRALQRKVGAEADGVAGSGTFSALQRYLGTYEDGVIDYPSNCVKELQRRLNAGNF